MKSIKGFSAHKINEQSGEKGDIWQAGYFDKIIRDENDLLIKIKYIINNPIRATLVETIEKYKWIFVKDYIERWGKDGQESPSSGGGGGENPQNPETGLSSPVREGREFGISIRAGKSPL